MFAVLYLTIVSVWLKGVWLHEIVTYWGQNGVSHAGGSEEELLYYCNNFEYDVIVIGFLHVFFDSSNKDKYPSINLSKHCHGSYLTQQYPTLLNCPKIGNQIMACQKKKKQVLISLGGASGLYGFNSKKEALLLARTVWNIFLGGSSTARTFGTAVLDGLDLDIEGGSSLYYTDFVKEMRSLMTSQSGKRYIITAAPQCPFPDQRLGPGKSGTVLYDVGQEFDHIYIQYYNNFCHLGSGNAFETNIQKWFEYAKSTNDMYKKGPLIFVGLPANKKASSKDLYYQAPDAVKAVYNKHLKVNRFFGGFMLWDAGFDQSNMQNGKTYSSNLRTFMKRSVPTKTPTNSSNEDNTTDDNSKSLHPGLIVLFILVPVLIIAIFLLPGRILKLMNERNIFKPEEKEMTN